MELFHHFRVNVNTVDCPSRELVGMLKHIFIVLQGMFIVMANVNLIVMNFYYPRI